MKQANSITKRDKTRNQNIFFKKMFLVRSRQHPFYMSQMVVCVCVCVYIYIHTYIYSLLAGCIKVVLIDIPIKIQLYQRIIWHLIDTHDRPYASRSMVWVVMLGSSSSICSYHISHVGRLAKISSHATKSQHTHILIFGISDFC